MITSNVRGKGVSFGSLVEIVAAWLLAILWISPLLYAFWAAFHSSEYAIHFDLLAPLTLENFREALSQAPFLRYGINTFLLVTMLLASQLVICTLAAYAFARYQFAGSNIAFALVLVQLMVAPEILIVENYGTLANLGAGDFTAAITGPVARGDAGTVARNLAAVADVPGAAAVYRALGLEALRVATPRLDESDVERVRRALDDPERPL